jgi:hypothetical protein
MTLSPKSLSNCASTAERQSTGTCFQGDGEGEGDAERPPLILVMVNILYMVEELLLLFVFIGRGRRSGCVFSPVLLLHPSFPTSNQVFSLTALPERAS